MSRSLFDPEDSRVLKAGVFALSSCGGDSQIVLAAIEAQREAFSGLEVVCFPMMMSSEYDGPLDLAFVEGVVATREDERKLRELRQRSQMLVALGTCAVWGGIAASKQAWGGKANRVVPMRAVVDVDHSLPGCPVNVDELDRLIVSLSNRLHMREHSRPVCFECKFNENPCFLLERNALCLGPVTHGGCGAKCPSHGMECHGCRGPVDEANWNSLVSLLKARGYREADIVTSLRTFGRMFRDFTLELEEEEQ